MTPDSSARADTGSDLPAGEVRDQAVLRSAADAMREHVDDRWVEVADLVLARAIAATRPSRPVLARASSGAFHVAEQVLVSSLRASIDRLEDCEVVDIDIQTRPPGRAGADDWAGEVCTGVLIALAVRYGTVLIPLADQVRRLASERIDRVLGHVVPSVDVSAMHVHVADVTRGDPKLGVDARQR